MSKSKKLLNKVFSKEELLEIVVEVLKEDRKLYSNSKRVQDLLVLSIQKNFMKDSIYISAQKNTR